MSDAEPMRSETTHAVVTATPIADDPQSIT
jgi:hypothetical protein